VFNALVRSLQVDQLVAIRTCEVNIKEKIKEALIHDNHFHRVKEFLQQELEGTMSKNY